MEEKSRKYGLAVFLHEDQIAGILLLYSYTKNDKTFGSSRSLGGQVCHNVCEVSVRLSKGGIKVSDNRSCGLYGALCVVTSSV